MFRGSLAAGGHQLVKFLLIMLVDLMSSVIVRLKDTTYESMVIGLIPKL